MSFWLWICYTLITVDYFQSRVHFHMLGHPSFSYGGNGIGATTPLIYAIEAHRLLSNGYLEYLAYAMGKQ